MNLGFQLYCLLLFLKGSRSSMDGAPGKAFTLLQVVSSHLYHTCTVSATKWGGQQEEQMLFLSQTYKEHFTDSTGPSLPRQSIWCTLSFPLIQQWPLKFQYIGWVSLEHYGCCCAFIPRHHYTFKCCISFSTINSLTMVISCNKFHCLVFVLSSDIFPFGVVWEGAQALLDLLVLCYSPGVKSLPLGLIILDSSLSWAVLFFHCWLQKFWVSQILFILVSGSLCCWRMMWNGVLMMLYNILSGSTVILERSSTFCQFSDLVSILSPGYWTQWSAPGSRWLELL